MRSIKKDITILAIGDRIDYDSYRKFDSGKVYLNRHGFDYAATSYSQFLSGRVPRINSQKVIIFLFFPFTYWNKHIEHKNYRGIYGNHTFHTKFVHFWERVEHKINRTLPGREILFVNTPDSCGFCRDKLKVIEKLARSHILQPKLYRTSSVEEIQKKLDKGHNLFLKPRYGSMGKGITFLSKSNWETNFTVKDSRIISKRSDHGWTFTDVTGNYNFLKHLIEKDILIEEAIDAPILDGNKVDLRIYTFFDRVIYVYPRKNTADKVTTNISQGGHGDPRLLKVLPRDMISRAKKEAIKAAKTLDIGLAGIDIIPDRHSQKAYVIDVNVFSGFLKKRTFNIASCITRELKRAH